MSGGILHCKGWLLLDGRSTFAPIGPASDDLNGSAYFYALSSSLNPFALGCPSVAERCEAQSMQIGYPGWAILLAILVVTVIAMQRVERSLKKNPPLESPQTKRRLAITVVGVVVLATLSVTVVPDLLESRKLVAIQQHGQRAEGIVDSIYVAGCGRSGPCSLDVRYRYAAPSPQDGRMLQLTGNEYLGPKYSDDPHFVYASTNGRVPIAYDLNSPQNSALNFDDSVFAGTQARARVTHAQNGLWTFLIAGGIFLLWSLVFGLARRWLPARPIER